jgi:hypothetical protein
VDVALWIIEILAISGAALCVFLLLAGYGAKEE